MRQFKLRRNHVARAAMMMALAWPASAYAQDSAGTAPEAEEAPDEIIVTALRRDTSLDKTPLSVAAISGDDLGSAGVRDFIDIASSVPGFTLIDNGPSSRRPIIRGIVGSGEGQVGIYYDEFAITSSPGATNDAGRFSPDFKLIDVAQVQILRGPQGTLFGAGSQGGTLQTIFNKPDLAEASAHLSAEVAAVSNGRPNSAINAVFNLPLVRDVLGIRLVGWHETQGGYIDNRTLGIANINRGHNEGARLALKFAPGERFSLELLGLVNRAQYDAGNHVTTSLGGLQSDVPAFDPLEDRNILVGATARYAFDFADLTVNASYYDRKLNYDLPYPNLAIPWAFAAAQGVAPQQPGEPNVATGDILQPQTTKAPTFELRLNAPEPDSPLQWTIGAYYQDRKAFTESRVGFVGPGGTPTDRYPIYQDRFVRSHLEQIAVFGEASYKFFDSLTLTAGGRWAKFNVDGANSARINTGGMPVPQVWTGRSFSGEKFVKRFNLAWEAKDNILLYATYSEGFRAGGVNQLIATEPTIPAGFGPDLVTNYEAGFKTQWFGRKLTVNFDVYRMDWDNIQVQSTTPSGLFRFISNAAKARVDGVELEITGRPTSNLDLRTTFGTTNARLTEDQPFNPGINNRGYAGDKLPYVPKASINLSADYSVPLGDDLTLSFHPEFQYVGKSRNIFNPFLTNTATGAITGTPNPGFVAIPDYSLVNFRAELDAANWTVSIFTRNLFDKRGITTVFWNPPFTPGRYTYYVTPRTIGISATTRF
ncbi:outer membrane receptor protein involved in Fe transport [Sphingopyxis sp. OAS728]|uniref:TonB-dependent receptor n=1 Tax=Sphingopyxis sp. OAS728 TaxID=2663823 RepID=UPI00178B7A0B|nr:TonB-dependent receptor [Sphingopyxis sp. OAS728]MBE1528001.1 outer membrane receptor protein involved in Fe transport [Sphingopyxis sp. OAS728]